MSDSIAIEEPPFKQVKFNLPKVGIMDLPNEILKKIFLHLKKKTVHFSVALVCKRFCEITRLPKFCEVLKIKLCFHCKKHKIRGNDYNIKHSCLEKIKNVLTIYPDCKLTLHNSGMNTEKFLGLVKFLGPFQASISRLELGFIGDNLYMDWRQFNKMIPLENLNYLHLDFTHYHDENFTIYDLPGSFWSCFPALKKLQFEHNSESMVSIKLPFVITDYVFVLLS